MKKGVILYYVVGPVHRKNMELIAQGMPDWEFVMLYEPDCWWNSPTELAKFNFEKVAFKNYRVPEQVWGRNIRSVIFSIVQPRPAPLNLLKATLEHKIPTINIEETNQMALNQGVINFPNNYLYPTDYTFVASEFERDTLIKLGVPKYRLEVTGWPFYSGSVGRISEEVRKETKIKLGLDPHRPVATLTLTAFGAAGEIAEIRCRQLTLASKGLPPDYQLIVKPHPVEKLATLQPFIEECAPQARIIEGMVSVNEVLQATDILLNRGVSQVAIEALLQNIPVVVLDTGISTPFHGYADDIIAEHPSRLKEVLLSLLDEENPMRYYDKFKATHMPYLPDQARKLTCKRISEISNSFLPTCKQSDQWLELALFQLWRNNSKDAAFSILSAGANGCAQETEGLLRLINNSADRNHLYILKAWLGGSFREDILRSLWIKQLHKSRFPITDEDIKWLAGFPPLVNKDYFLEYVLLLAQLLLKYNKTQALDELIEKIRNNASYSPQAKEIIWLIEKYNSGWHGRLEYKFWVLLKDYPYLLKIISKIRIGLLKIKTTKKKVSPKIHF